MTPTASEPGPVFLRTVRRDAGMTQEQLAEASGVSVRTIRGLETGKITAPHRASLLALADGLYDSPDQADELIRAWTSDRDVISLAELFGAAEDPTEQLAEIRARLATDVQDLSLTQRSRVNADRVFTEHVVAKVVRAVHDGVDRIPVLMTFADHPDISQVTVDGLANCVIRERYVNVEARIVVVELGLGKSLRQGETQLIQYRVDCAAAPVGATSPPEPRLTGSVRQGTRRLLAQLLLEVTFESEPPARIWRFLGKDREPRGELVPNSFGSVHVLEHNLEPGFVGVAWEWD